MADPNKANLYAQTYALAMKTIHGDKMKRKERQDIIKARRLLKQMRAELGYTQDPTTGKMKAGKQGNALDQLTGEDVGRWDKNAQAWVKDNQITYYASGQRAPAGTPAPAPAPVGRPDTGGAAAERGGGRDKTKVYRPLGARLDQKLTRKASKEAAANPWELNPVSPKPRPKIGGRPFTPATEPGSDIAVLEDLEQWMRGDVVYPRSTPTPKRTKPTKDDRKSKRGRR